MLVNLARVADSVVLFGLSGRCDLEGSSWHNDVGRVRAAGPFLAVEAMAQGGHGRFALY